MRRRLLVRHFLYQFVENDFSADTDRHQVLALAAAGVITVPLFITVFMGWTYLMRPLQAPGWTAIALLDDQMVFCGTSMLLSAIIATLQWDALALSRRDAMIFGLLPLPRREVVRAKGVSLVVFAAAFVGAVNALPAILHPPLMAANLPLNPVMLLPLIAAHAMSTVAAGAFGFGFVVALRELLYAALRRRAFEKSSDVVRSALLFVLFVLLALLPMRLPGAAESLLEPGGGPLIQRPVSWFAAADATIAGAVLDRLAQPDMPAWRAKEDEQLRTRYRHAMPRLHALAARGLAAAAALLALACCLYFWNARRLHLLPEEQGRTGILRLSRVMAATSGLLGGMPAKRAGAAFLFRTAFDSPQHRLYLIMSAAVAIALLNATLPTPISDGPEMIRTSQVAAQTLMLTAVLAGFRAVVRTSADERAAWTFAVANTGNLGAFRAGVRLGVLSVALALVFVLFPMHAHAWGVPLALRHAVSGAALACLLAEIACGNVEQPLIMTIPPNDALNTVGTVFLGAIVILVFVLAHIERAALATVAGTAFFTGSLLAAALYARRVNARNYTANLPSASMI